MQPATPAPGAAFARAAQSRLAAGSSIAFHGEDSRGWDYKVQKALEHAKTLGLRPLPLDPKAPADLLLVVESKAFLQAQRGSAVEGKRWAAQ